MKQLQQKLPKKFLFIPALMLLSSFVFAQSQNRQTLSQEENYDPIIEALDSLLSQHYSQKLYESNGATFSENDFEGKDIPVYSDDIYAKRIQKIQTDIPLTYNAQVKEYLNLYAINRRNLTQRMMGLSNLYFPLYEQILDEQGLPHEFKYLSIVESALNPLAVSRMGATGLWQFMLATGKMYDLKVNTLIDERRDPIKSTYAACKYFKDMYAIYNDWLLVIAAYNCGPGNVNRAIIRSGGKRTFWEISPFLPKETRGYVPAFIAVTYLLNYSAEHNLNPIAPEFSYFETDTVMVDQKMHLRDIAHAIDFPLEKLTYLNPVYKRGIIPESDVPQVLRLPSSKINAYLSNVEQIYQRNAMISAPIAITTVSESSAKNSDAVSEVKKRHLIRNGEHLHSIAKKYNCTVNDLKKWNNLHSSQLRAGNYLTVYVRSTSQQSATSTNKNSQTSTQAVQKSQSPSTQNNTSVTRPADKNTKVVYHIVEPGDTLWDIAKRYEGVTVQRIKEFNRLNSNNLKVGTKLKVPVNG